MSRSPSQPEHLRVVLVGRTGLEASLRRDGDMELLRPRGALDALGELAEVADEHDTQSTLVLVGPHVVSPDRTASFIAAIRRIVGGAKVFTVGKSSAPEYDGVVAPGADAQAVRKLAHSAETPPPAAPAAPAMNGQDVAWSQPTMAAPPPEAAESVVTIPTAPPAPPTVNVHEHTPLGAMLTGRDPVAIGLNTIKELLGAEVSYTPGPDAPEGPCAPVVYAGRTFGFLSAAGVDPSSLAREASWLAGWAAIAAQQEQLRKAAFTDELTGACNRRYFSRFLGAAIEQARSARRNVTLLVFDIDNFKRYNDHYGHTAGDEILIESVRLLTSVIRPSDRVCRIGGDEFAVIFHDPEGARVPTTPNAGDGLASIADIARRFQKQICEHRFPKLSDEAPGTLTISGGMATFPWDGNSVQELLDRADALAMQSKKQGKNAITLGQGAQRACERPGSSEN